MTCKIVCNGSLLHCNVIDSIVILLNQNTLKNGIFKAYQQRHDTSAGDIIHLIPLILSENTLYVIFFTLIENSLFPFWNICDTISKEVTKNGNDDKTTR